MPSLEETWYARIGDTEEGPILSEGKERGRGEALWEVGPGRGEQNLGCKKIDPSELCVDGYSA